MESTLTQLYPAHADNLPLRGLYLAHRLHERASTDQPFIYANFVTSLDGRIAFRNPASGESEVPRELASGSDLRLLLELHAQADCLVTNAGYLRAISDRRLDDILQVGTVAGHEDLGDWRIENGLARQPAVCIASATLDFPFAPSLARHGQHVFVVTGRKADPRRIAALEAQGREVVLAGDESGVQGAALAQALSEKRFRSAFLLAGPGLLDTTLRDRVLSRFYITLTHELLGGESFRSLLDGPPTAGTGRLKLRTLYLETPGGGRASQFFAQFEPA